MVFILGDWIEDEDQIIRLKCNYIISAFGSTLNELPGYLFYFDFIKEIYLLRFYFIVIQALEPLVLDKYNYPVVNLTTMSSSVAGVFCGGDIAKIASTTVESVNDGKTAAWHMHRFIQV